MDNIWFTSDTHFNHANIIPYERQHYTSVDEMNRDLIARWNARVKPGDVIYHLGDVALGKFDDLPPIIAQLNGDIQLVLGNHDWSATKMEKAGIFGATKQRLIEIGTCRLWLAHIPSDNSVDRRDLKRPNIDMNYDIELCGHVHSAWKTQRQGLCNPIVNVGVDVWDLQPISLEEILEAAYE